MKSIRALLLTAVAVLALAAPAAAKEITQAQICGDSGCTTISDRETLRSLPHGGEATAEPPAAAEFYTLAFTFEAAREQHQFRMYYVPSANLLAANGQTPAALAWFTVDGEALDAIRAAVDGLEPFPALERGWPAEIKSPARLRTAGRAAEEDGAPFLPWIALAAGAVAFAALGGLTIVLRRRRSTGAAALPQQLRG